MRIEVDRVTFRYGPQVTALRHVSLTINAGETVAILGENGAGKTTLAKHFNALLKPDEGAVRIGGWDTRNRSPAELARRVSYAFQNPDDQLFERTVRQEVAFGPRNLGLSDRQIEARVSGYLGWVGLERQGETHPYDLHPTERKFVAVAASLALESPIVVLDEPTTGQDTIGVQRMAEIVHRLEEQGRTVVAISHDVDFCAENFNRAILMANGEILADGPMASVLERREALTQAAVSRPQLARLADSLELGGTPLGVEEFLHLLRGANEQEGAQL